jgi:hypothetical protein
MFEDLIDGDMYIPPEPIYIKWVPYGFCYDEEAIGGEDLLKLLEEKR